MGEKKYDVVVVGMQCIDIVCSPVAPGIMDRETTVVESAKLMLGGDAQNQAISLASLGAKVALTGVVGNDRMGDVLLKQLSAFPITLLERREDVNTSVSLVLVAANGDRHFIYQPQSNQALGYRHIDLDAVRNAAFLSVGGCLSLPGLDGADMLKLLDLAHESGVRTALDFNVTDYMLDPAALKALLSRTDYVLPSEAEVRALTGEGGDPAEMVRRLRALGATNCVIKLGGRGCYVAADGFEGAVPPYPCRCVDTTGAGDTFVAAFLYARTRGWDILRCARFANAAGSIAVEHPGANGGIHSAAQVEARMGLSQNEL